MDEMRVCEVNVSSAHLSQHEVRATRCVCACVRLCVRLFVCLLPLS